MNKIITGKYENWALDQDENNILWLTLDKKNSSTNTLNKAVLHELDNILTSISQGTVLTALVIRSGKTTGFIAGADITEFADLKTAEEATMTIAKGQAIFNKLADLHMPTIALISGFCLGGGLELALACDYRIAEESPKTSLGLPEVKLGIHPGWGGTIRLPKLIGAIHAMDLILSGRSVNAKQAKAIHLVDEAVPKRNLHKAVLHYALYLAKSGGKSKSNLINNFTNTKIARVILSKIFYRQLRAKINQAHYPAPYKVVDNWVKWGVEGADVLEKEALSIGELVVSETAKQLGRVFFLQEKLKNQAKKSDAPMTHLHVVGAGVMGGDIAAWAALKGLQVTLEDKTPELVGSAIKRAYGLATKQLKAKHLVQAMMDRLMPDPRGFGVFHADVIIEAITENKEAKQLLFTRLEKEAKSTAILASNTSTIPLEEISEVLENPGRLVGIHFFNPVSKMPLVEIIHGVDTQADVLRSALGFVRQIDKLPLLVKSAPGFLVNRILMPYMMEAVMLFKEGVPGPVIDKVAKDFGMPMGPIALADAVGLDVCLAAIQKLSPVLGMEVPQELKNLVQKGQLGRKTGRGFYSYDKKGNQLRATRVRTQITHVPSDCSERLIFRMQNEAMACLREGIVASADEVDAGCIFGFGFAPFRGGPLAYASAQGHTKISEGFAQLAIQYGDRFTADKGWSQSQELWGDKASNSALGA